LTRNLKRIPAFTIRKAEVAMKFKRAEKHLATYGHDMHEDLIQIRQKIAQEYDAFSATLNDWAKLKEQDIEAKKAAVAEKIHQVDARLKLEFQHMEQRMHQHGERMESMMQNLKRQMRRQPNVL
jgi:stearoyl-CoA desaturase (delta-9 desaturase)